METTINLQDKYWFLVFMTQGLLVYLWWPYSFVSIITCWNTWKLFFISLSDKIVMYLLGKVLQNTIHEMLRTLFHRNSFVFPLLWWITIWLLHKYLCRHAIGVSSVVAAMLGLSILLLLGVLDWDDCLNEKSAWDTLAWFAVLVGMAAQLTNLGIVSWMSSCVAKLLQSFSLSWLAAFCVLEASYFLIHYLFASQTGHVGALYSAFLAMHVAAGVPRVLSALALAFNTNLFGALTHYSSGQAAVYFGGNSILNKIIIL